MNRKGIQRTIVLLALIFIIVYAFKNSGYSLVEQAAIRNSFPFQDGTKVYENEETDNQTVIWKTDNGYYAKLVESKWGFLYHVSNVSMLQVLSPLNGKEGDIERTWSANLNSDNKYDTIFAVKSNNPEIKKVIISNDNIDDNISTDIHEIKKESTLFMELNLENGFAATYKELNVNDAGGFVFRGVNEKGKVIVLGV
ncbi:hypothetical protein [Paenibacillus dauci]|uniref:hypothetical protein n=1 Tax=Paenibacillus dauci TaxID=1567106 RepID=UPI0006193219|nr:hypothetical protein [Paenibacillus dauci]